MNKVNTTAVVLAVVALIVGVVSFTKTPAKVSGLNGSQGARGEQGVAGPRGPQGERGATGAPGRDAQVKLGAVSSPDILSPYFSYGDTRFWGFRPNLLTASTTVCNIQAPAATTTLEGFSLDVKTGTTSEVHLQFATSPTPDATTSVLANFTLAANSKNQVSGTSTLAHQVIPGSTWFVIKASPTLAAGAAGAQGTVSMTGTCSANFRAIQY